MGTGAIFQILISSIILFTFIGISAISGLIIIILLVLPQIFISKLIHKFKKKILYYSDKRIKIINEILLGVNFNNLINKYTD
jgi:hypothetical protein